VIEFDIYYDEGISRTGEILDMAVERNLVQKSGTWFSYGDERLGQGRENARGFLKEHPELLDQLDTKLRVELGLAGAVPPGEEAPETPPGEKGDKEPAGNGRKVKAKA
jgi:recombination protein RecA